MYTKQEVSKLRQAFWTTFGQYMQPVSPADGSKVNWVNYKTGVPGITFKMEADNEHASIAIVLSAADAAIQEEHYTLMTQLRTMLHNTLGEQWQWQQAYTNEYGKPVSTISTTLGGVSILRNEDWPALISFFKTRIIALDEFWSMARHSF